MGALGMQGLSCSFLTGAVPSLNPMTDPGRNRATFCFPVASVSWEHSYARHQQSKGEFVSLSPSAWISGGEVGLDLFQGHYEYSNGKVREAFPRPLDGAQVMGNRVWFRETRKGLLTVSVDCCANMGESCNQLTSFQCVVKAWSL